MKINFAQLSILAIAICTYGCHANNQNQSATKNDSSSISYPSDKIPEFRKEIKKEAVAEYKEKTDNPLNNWYFSVRLYETPKTFEYLLKMQFEEVRGEDTLLLPNFGVQPQPVLHKGKDKYSCIIGFMDNENKFREYKMVYVKDGNVLKLVTLNHYAVVVTEK